MKMNILTRVQLGLGLEIFKTDVLQTSRSRELNSYTISAKIGTDWQTTAVRLLPDTGSGKLWVMSNKCTEPVCLERNTVAPPLRVVPSERFLIKYVSGKLEGDLVSNTVSIDEMTFPASLVMVDKIDIPVLSQLSYDGILGLGFPLPNQKDISPLSAIRDSGVLPDDRNNFKLGFAKGSNFIDFGVDPDPETRWLSLCAATLGSHFWAVTMVSPATKQSFCVVIDSGTADNYFPSELLKKGGGNFVLEAEDNPSVSFEIAKPKPGQKTTHRPSDHLANDTVIFGASFLNEYNIIHDFGNMRLAFERVAT